MSVFVFIGDILGGGRHFSFEKQENYSSVSVHSVKRTELFDLHSQIHKNTVCLFTRIFFSKQFLRMVVLSLTIIGEPRLPGEHNATSGKERRCVVETQETETKRGIWGRQREA